MNWLRYIHWFNQQKAANQRNELAVEFLETRTLLSSDGLPTGDSAYLTLSFSPDGTDVAGHPSAIFEKFNQLGSESEWKTAITNAFQTWASQTNADIGVVSDDASDFGTPGQRRNDSRFGDIRIGSAPLSADVMAISIPEDAIVSGTWVGDVIFNSDAQFESLEQLFSVALHEAGHVFGLEHTENESSPMHLHGPTPNTTLTDEDRQLLQDHYGVRADDLNETHNRNDTLKGATELQKVTMPEQDEGSGPTIAFGDITTKTDVDFYKIEVPGDYEGSRTVRLRTAGLSLFTGRMTIIDEHENQIAQASSSGGLSNEISITFHPDSDDDFYVRVEGLDETDRSIGGYALITSFDDVLTVSQSEIDLVTSREFRMATSKDLRKFFQDGEDPRIHDDQHADDDFAFAIELKPFEGFSNGPGYETFGTISNANDIDSFSFKSPSTHESMLISIASLESGRLIPSVKLYDRNFDPVPIEVLLHGDGQLVVQATEFLPDKTYYVQLGSEFSESQYGTGNYQLTISFRQLPVVLETMAESQLSASTPQMFYSFHIAQPQLFHFRLAPTSDSPNSNGVKLRLLDDVGGQVFELAAVTGHVRSSSGILLQPGSYSFNAQYVPIDVDNLSPVSFVLAGSNVSGTFGVEPIDPLNQPAFRCDDISNDFCFPGGVITPNPFHFEPSPRVPLNPIASLNATLESIAANWWTWLHLNTVENHVPEVVQDAYELTQGESLRVESKEGVLKNDFDPDGDLLFARLDSGPKQGSLNLKEDGSFEYFPNPDYVGLDTFEYFATDRSNTSRIVSVSITVYERPPSLPGDANRDGIFNSADLIRVFQAGEYEDGIAGNSVWKTGDWNGDGEFDTKDLIAAFQEGNYSRNARPYPIL